MANNDVYILTNFESPRLHYTLNEFFLRRLGLNPIIIFHIIAYNINAPLVVYGSFECKQPHLRLKNWDILHQHTIEPLDPSFNLSRDFNEIDPLAATFLLLSRYEEYLPFKKDSFDSFPYKKSMAFKNQLLQEPIIDIWATQIAQTLISLFVAIAITLPKPKKVLTVDVDIAYAFKGRSNTRTFLAATKDLLKLNIGAIKKRYLVLTNKTKDPFDNYEAFIAQSKFFDETIFFFPAGKNNRFNRHIPIDSPIIKNLINSIPKTIKIGLHPIKQNNKTVAILNSEKQDLEIISNQNITLSRQHYLHFKLPETYTQLIHAGITNDYSMGYNAVNGFRASTCQCFNFYNVQEDKATELICHPLIAMDAVYIYNQKIPLNKAIEETTELIDLCKKFNGDFIIDFHNNHIQPSHAWHKYYVQILQYLQKY